MTDRNRLVSVTLTLSKDADPSQALGCLASVAEQTYEPIEVLVFISEGCSLEVHDVLAAVPAAKIHRGLKSKTGARNLLADLAAGKYMLFLDADLRLSPTLVEDCVLACQAQGGAAAVSPVVELPKNAILSKMRALERQLALRDPKSSVPVFIEMDAFRSVGGFDESLDLLDDWVLTAKLISQGFKIAMASSPLWISEYANLMVLLSRKYQRGRLMPEFRRRFPEAPFTGIGGRFLRSFSGAWRFLVKSPGISLILLVVKALETSALLLGGLVPVRPRPHVDGTRPYFTRQIAGEYDRVRLGDKPNRYKHLSEMRALSALINATDEKLLEIGCGTGRATTELTLRGVKVVASDPSRAMLSEYLRKPALPSPIVCDGRALPFAGHQFEGSYSVRVIWHLPSQADFERMLGEMLRVSRRFAVIDISNEKRWRGPLGKAIAALMYWRNPEALEAHKSSRLSSLKDLSELVGNWGFAIDTAVPLDVIPPFWTEITPNRLFDVLFPFMSTLDTFLARLVAPARYMVRVRSSREG
ncbi:MAG TPA: methyltransferase domain-containing protein [Candidatus Tectomicrobia bacterium]